MKHSKTSLFLMELILALLFFSLASTVCIQMYAKAHTLSRESCDLNYAVTQAQNLAEAFTGLEGDLLQLQALYADSRLNPDGSELTIMDGEYRSTLLCTPLSPAESDGCMVSADITILHAEQSEPIYTLHVDLFCPERRGHNE